MIIPQLFTERSVHHLEAEYLPRVERALGVLPETDLWWRPNQDVTSVGNLLLHLEGNVRQWILSGVAGHPNERARATEFEAQDGSARDVLFERLTTTVRQACRVIEPLSAEGLERTYTIQGFQTTALGAVYHVVEHFSWHTGQITWIAKARAGQAHGLAFYDDDQLNQSRNA